MLEHAADSAKLVSNENPGSNSEMNWLNLYTAILRLKSQEQTIITLRFFENMPYEQIAGILNIKDTTLRVVVHRIINKLRNDLENVFDKEV